MKIGILINKLQDLILWQLHLIEHLNRQSQFDIVLLTLDYNKNLVKLDKYEKSGLLRDLATGVLSFQENLEKKRYKLECQQAMNSDLIHYINSLSTITLKANITGGVYHSNPQKLDIVKKFHLDVILMLESIKISNEIKVSAKLGVWTLNFSNYSGTDSSLAGFWEVLYKKSYITVSIIKLGETSKDTQVIDRAYLNRHISSFAKTKDLVLKSSVLLVLKNFKKLSEIGEDIFQYDRVGFEPKYNSPGLNSALKYSLNYYRHLFTGFFKDQSEALGTRYKSWTLFISSGDFLNSDITKLIPLKIPRDEYWADPFLLRHCDVLYVFFENYSYKTKRGKISCGKIENSNITQVTDVLVTDYHLSYPFIFKENGEIYLMPESSHNNRLEIYKCINFPDLWELYTTAFEGESVVDASIFKDENSQNWLFVNKEIIPGTGKSNELYIYKFDSLKLDKLESHKENPVIIDSRVARNGGAIFKYKDKYYRPSQCNTDGVYGRALNINQIDTLSITEYSEKTIQKIEPDKIQGLVSMHHLHQIDGMFVFDGAYGKKKNSGMVKIFYSEGNL